MFEYLQRKHTYVKLENTYTQSQNKQYTKKLVKYIDNNSRNNRYNNK